MNSDITIIGAGINGSALALALSYHTNLSITLIDAHPLLETTHNDLRVSAINLNSQTFFQRLKIWEMLDKQFIAPYKRMFIWNDQGKLEFDSQLIKKNHLGYIVHNHALLFALHQKIKQQTNIQFIQDIPITLHNSYDGVFITLSNHQHYKTSLLIGADGARSWVRKTAGFQTTETPYGHTAIVAEIQCEKPLLHTAYQRFTTDGPVGILPLHKPNHASIVWSQKHTTAKRLMEMDDNAFAHTLTSTLENQLGNISLISQRKTFPLIERKTYPFIQPHIALVGDAAHTIHPLAGLGLNLGLSDVECLFNLINSTPNTINNQLLHTYQRTQCAKQRQIQKTISGLKWLFEQTNPEIKLIRNMGLTCTNQLNCIKQLLIDQASCA